MSTPLSADAASKILVDAFQPLGCVVSSGADGHDLALGVVDAQGKTLYTEEQLGEADYADPLRLAAAFHHRSRRPPPASLQLDKEKAPVGAFVLFALG